MCWLLALGDIDFNTLVSEIMSKIAENFINGSITFVLNLVNGLLNSSASALNNADNVRSNFADYMAGLYAIIAAVYATALVVFSLYKVLRALIEISTGNREYKPIGQIIWDVVVSSASRIMLPWILGLVTAFLPNLQVAITNATVTEVKSNIYALIDRISTEGYSSVFGTSAVFPLVLLILIFLTVSNVFYYFTMAKYQVDLMLLEIMAPAAALDKATENKEFYTTWKRTIISIFISVACKILLNGVMCVATSKLVANATLFTNPFNAYYMLIIGCGICIIKEPEIVKTYKYSSGAGHGVMNLLRSATLMMR